MVSRHRATQGSIILYDVFIAWHQGYPRFAFVQCSRLGLYILSYILLPSCLFTDIFTPLSFMFLLFRVRTYVVVSSIRFCIQSSSPEPKKTVIICSMHKMMSVSILACWMFYHWTKSRITYFMQQGFSFLLQYHHEAGGHSKVFFYGFLLIVALYSLRSYLFVDCCFFLHLASYLFTALVVSHDRVLAVVIPGAGSLLS